MNIKRKNRRFVAAVVGAGAFVMASGVAYTAANSVEASNAGDGSQTISGYTVSAQDYTLNATNPGNVDSVSFTMVNDGTGTDTPGQVYVELVSGSGTYYSCTNVLTTWTCTTTTPQATAASVDSFRVIAAD